MFFSITPTIYIISWSVCINGLMFSLLIAFLCFFACQVIFAWDARQCEIYLVGAGYFHILSFVLQTIWSFHGSILSFVDTIAFNSFKLVGTRVFYLPPQELSRFIQWLEETWTSPKPWSLTLLGASFPGGSLPCMWRSIWTQLKALQSALSGHLSPLLFSPGELSLRPPQVPSSLPSSQGDC